MSSEVGGLGPSAKQDMRSTENNMSVGGKLQRGIADRIKALCLPKAEDTKEGNEVAEAAVLRSPVDPSVETQRASAVSRH